MDNNVWKYTQRLSRQMAVSLLWHLFHRGGIALAFPFFLFVYVADTAIKPQALALAAVLCAPLLWVNTWDFVRLSLKREYPVFCNIWWRALPQQPAAAPEGDNNPRPPSRLLPVNVLFLLRLLAGIVAGGIACAFLMRDGGDFSSDDIVSAVLILLAAWLVAEYLLLGWLLRRAMAANAALAAVVEAEARRKLRITWGFGLFARDMWYFMKDITIWGWLLSPVWMALVIVGLGFVPQPQDQKVQAYFNVPEPVLGPHSGIYALEGLEAPLATKDFAAYGRARVEAMMAGGTVKPARDAAEVIQHLSDFDHFTICTGRKPTEAEWRLPPPPPPVVAPSTAAPEQKLPAVPPALPSVPAQRCLYLEEWGSILEANKELLARYESLSDYTDFRQPNAVTMQMGSSMLLMDLARLETIALVYRAYKGDAEGAMKQMIANARFAKKWLETPMPMVPHAVAMTNEVLVFQALPYILSRAPSLVAQYRGDIESLLLNLTDDPAQLGAVWDADTRFLPYMMQHQMDGMRGMAPFDLSAKLMAASGTLAVFKARLYALSQDVHAALALKTVAAREKALRQIENRYGAYMPVFYRLGDMAHMFQSFAAGLIISGTVKGLALFYMQDTRINKARVNLVLLSAYAQGALPETAAGSMADFVRQAPARDARLDDVRDGSAFLWQADKRALCFDRRDIPQQQDLFCLETPSYVWNEAALPAGK